MRLQTRAVIHILLASIVAILVAGCAHIAAPWAKRPEGDVERQRQQWNQLVAYRKPADLAALVTDDVQLITPSGIVSGKKSLARSYAEQPQTLSFYQTLAHLQTQMEGLLDKGGADAK